MNESIDNTKQHGPAGEVGGRSRGGLAAIVTVGVVLIAMGLAGLIGSSVAYCDGGVGRSLLWALFWIVVVPIQSIESAPGWLALVAAAYVVAVVAIAKWSPIRPGIRVVVVAVMVSGAAGWVITAWVSGVGRMPCGLV